MAEVNSASVKDLRSRAGFLEWLVDRSILPKWMLQAQARLGTRPGAAALTCEGRAAKEEKQPEQERRL